VSVDVAARARARRLARPVASSEKAEVGRRNLAVAAALKVIGDLLALVEARETGALDCGDVDERILGTIIRLDESKAFGGVEEFYGAIGHGQLFREVMTAEDMISKRQFRSCVAQNGGLERRGDQAGQATGEPGDQSHDG
jgi:hypothetical protein